jgi:hypothetical protein
MNPINLRPAFVYDKTINWFPGHMAKGLRLITEKLNAVQVIIEVRDARISTLSPNHALFALVLVLALLVDFIWKCFSERMWMSCFSPLDRIPLLSLTLSPPMHLYHLFYFAWSHSTTHPYIVHQP